MVPAVAGDRGVRLVAAQQHQLRPDRRHHRAPVHLAVREDHPRELLREIAQLGGDRPQGDRGRLRDSRQPARHDARRAPRQPAADAGDRDRPRDRGGEAPGRHLPRRLVHHQARPAVQPARQDAAREAGLPGSESPHLRRRVVDDGADEPRGGQGDRRQEDSRSGGRPGEGEGDPARRHCRRRRIARRRRALRIEQHDHAALPAQGREDRGDGKRVQAGQRHLPGRIVHRVRRSGARCDRWSNRWG